MFTVIPVLMPGCDSPPTGFLQPLTWVGLSKGTSVLEQTDGLEALRTALRGEAVPASAARAQVWARRRFSHGYGGAGRLGPRGWATHASNRQSPPSPAASNSRTPPGSGPALIASNQSSIAPAMEEVPLAPGASSYPVCLHGARRRGRQPLLPPQRPVLTKNGAGVRTRLRSGQQFRWQVIVSA